MQVNSHARHAVQVLPRLCLFVFLAGICSRGGVQHISGSAASRSQHHGHHELPFYTTETYLLCRNKMVRLYKIHIQSALDSLSKVLCPRRSSRTGSKRAPYVHHHHKWGPIWVTLGARRPSNPAKPSKVARTSLFTKASLDLEHEGFGMKTARPAHCARPEIEEPG